MKTKIDNERDKEQVKGPSGSCESRLVAARDVVAVSKTSNRFEKGTANLVLNPARV